MASASRTRYADSSGGEIAYQVLGDGPIDLLLHTGWTIPIECMDDDPSLHRFLERLASFSRLIRFDRRGTGLSDRGSPSSPPTPEQLSEDSLAVLDAVGSARAAVVAPYLSGVEGVMVAAKRPDRISSLVLINTAARVRWAPDYPDGIPDDEVVDISSGFDPDALELGTDLLGLLGPSVAEDPTFRAWWDRAGSLGATPAMAAAIWAGIFEVDIRHLLPQVSVPTLVVHSAWYRSPAWARYLAEHIAGAVCREVPGGDALYWTGDSGPMLDEIEEFLTGQRGGPSADRALATLLFTDIVGSTDRAASLGDRRWHDLLDEHDRLLRRQIQRFRGREVNTVGDGFLVTFDSPGRAIECALAMHHAVQAAGLDIRCGIHTGEVEIRGDDVAGLTVHIGARISALATGGQLLVSSTVKDLLAGSEVAFTDAGEHGLKGVPGTWHLYAVET